MANLVEHAIEVENLTKRYGDLLAVNGISFDVQNRRSFRLPGPERRRQDHYRRDHRYDPHAHVGKSETSRDGRHQEEACHRLLDRRLPQDFSSFDRITVRETMGPNRGSSRAPGVSGGGTPISTR